MLIRSFVNFLFIISISFLAILVNGCKEETECYHADKRLCDPNYVAPVVGIIPFDEDLTGYERKHLLEEFTGFLCTNCPTATATAKNLKLKYEGRLTVIAVHCTPFFASPLTTDPSQPFYKDFRTPEGEALYAFYEPPGLPDGVINRKGRNGLPTITYPFWADELDVLMQTNNPEVFVKINNLSINADSTELTSQIIVKPLIEVADNYTINCVILEFGIDEAQKAPGGVTIYDYKHDFVFRRASNGPWGTFAYDSALELQANEAIGFELKIPLEEDWNLSKCDVVVYISRESDRQIVQVEEHSLYE
jgi:hypothetical protein